MSHYRIWPLATTLILAALVLAYCSGATQAQTIAVQHCGRRGCTTYIGAPLGQPDARIIRVLPDPEAGERIRKWEAFCAPTIRRDEFQVPRYSYAHPGCEFGRTE